jgi:hypothetical protein
MDAVAGPMWRPRNAGVRDGTMSSNLLCSSGESANRQSLARSGSLQSTLPARAPSCGSAVRSPVSAFRWYREDCLAVLRGRKQRCKLGLLVSACWRAMRRASAFMNDGEQNE